MILRLIKGLRRYWIEKSINNIIILGTDYPEFKLYKLLYAKGKNIPFFISEDPWKHNSRIEQAFCKYPSELYALCEQYQIQCVYYCEYAWLAKIPDLPETTKLRLHSFTPASHD